MKIEKLQIQNLSAPLGIEIKHPMLSYSLVTEENEQQQSAYRILAASALELLDDNIGDLWDSGKVTGKNNFAITYKGRQLNSRQAVFWKVKVWDSNNIETDWSEPSQWEMGLLEEEDWKAFWIGQGDAYSGDKSKAPILAKEFTIHNYEDMVRSRLYISGLGLFEAEINGKKPDDTLFNPGESDYSKTVYYITYDITSLLTEKSNTISVLLGNGQYVNFIIDPVMTLDEKTESPKHRYQKNDGKFIKSGIYGNKKVIAQIEGTYTDGHTEIITATDDTWKISESPITFNNWYGGEDYDATMEIDNLGAVIKSWNQAVVMQKPEGKLTAREFTPIKIVEKFTAGAVTALSNGNWLIDMGRNVAGFPELKLLNTKKKDRGTKIRMYPAEMLKEDKTGVNQASCTQSWNQRYHCVIEDSYTVKGSGYEVWHPRFTYQGFRYVEVSGFRGTPAVENFSCCVVRTANEKNGFFECSNQVLNQINRITERSIESNMFGSFTDCPQIEKLGWIETSHLMFHSMASAYDIRGWIPKIVHDIADAQVDKTEALLAGNEEVGYVPAIVPEFQRIVGLHLDPNWGGACILTPWEYYQYYGDKNILEKSYPIMKNYIVYLEKKTTNGILAGYAQMGDWGQLNEETPVVLVATCAYYYLLVVISKVAGILNEVEDKMYFETLTDETKKSFHQNEECYHAAVKEYGNGSQSSYGCVLFSNIVLEEYRNLALKKLVHKIQTNDYHLTSGEVGLKQVFFALAENGRSDVVYKMVMNETPPSYKYFIDNKLTTLPEYWNYEELWAGMVRSGNHAMMGHVKEWLSSYVLGIKRLSAGYEEVLIKPYISENITSVKGNITCPYGKIELCCIIVQIGVEMIIRIPAGVTAQVYIPVQGSNPVSVNGIIYPAEFLKEEGYMFISNLKAGKYDIKHVLLA